MAVTGRLPLKKFQAAIEVTPGTALAATRFQPMLSGDLVRHRTREYPVEQRGSLIKNYGNSYVTKDYVEMQGMQALPTYEDLPWMLQGYAKGGVTASATNVTAYDYVFTPTIATDDLKTLTWEVGNDTQAYQVPFSIGTRIKIEGKSDGASMVTLDYLAQNAIPASLTSNLAVRTTEVINFASAQAFIDSTNIGTTAVFTVLDFSFELTTGQKQFSPLNGSLQPSDSYRGEQRMAKFDATLAFTGTTEHVAFTSNTTRKIRITATGSTITASSPSTTKILDIDWYGRWAEAPFGTADGLVVLKVSGESEYDTTLGGDWRIRVRNDLPTLP